MKKQVSAIFTFLFILAFALSACGQAPAEPTPTPLPMDKVIVQFNWFPNVEYAGFYVAAAKGYYAEAHLDVTLAPGGPSADSLGSVDSGTAQFGIVRSENLIISRAEGKDLVAVATIFKENPLTIISLKKENIVKPADLAGKTVGVYSLDLSDSNDLSFRALMDNVGLDPASMKFALIQDFSPNDVKSGRMDAASGLFAAEQQALSQQSGDALNFIYYDDYGFDAYVNTIFAKGELLKTNPDLVRRFVQATMKGYRYAIANSDEAAEITVAVDSSLDIAYQKELMEAQIPFINAGSSAIGFMDDRVWQNTQTILLDFGLISKPVELSSVYTNEFIAQ